MTLLACLTAFALAISLVGTWDVMAHRLWLLLDATIIVAVALVIVESLANLLR